MSDPFEISENDLSSLIDNEERPLVGNPTGEITNAGRPVLETPGGELVSELSRTIPIEDKIPIRAITTKSSINVKALYNL